MISFRLLLGITLTVIIISVTTSCTKQAVQGNDVSNITQSIQNVAGTTGRVYPIDLYLTQRPNVPLGNEGESILGNWTSNKQFGYDVPSIPGGQEWMRDDSSPFQDTLHYFFAHYDTTRNSSGSLEYNADGSFGVALKKTGETSAIVNGAVVTTQTGTWSLEKGYSTGIFPFSSGAGDYTMTFTPASFSDYIQGSKREIHMSGRIR